MKSLMRVSRTARTAVAAVAAPAGASQLAADVLPNHRAVVQQTGPAEVGVTVQDLNQTLARAFSRSRRERSRISGESPCN